MCQRYRKFCSHESMTVETKKRVGLNDPEGENNWKPKKTPFTVAWLSILASSRNFDCCLDLQLQVWAKSFSCCEQPCPKPVLTDSCIPHAERRSEVTVPKFIDDDMSVMVRAWRRRFEPRTHPRKPRGDRLKSLAGVTYPAWYNPGRWWGFDQDGVKSIRKPGPTAGTE